jgi:phosphoribosyl-ATP pyrophosphohydrolase
MTLDELFALITDRRANRQPGSYTNSLFDKGEDAILQKVGEEAVEVILAGKGQGNQRVIEETADLFYHTLVMLAQRGLSLADVQAELGRRHASRKTDRQE